MTTEYRRKAGVGLNPPTHKAERGFPFFMVMVLLGLLVTWWLTT